METDHRKHLLYFLPVFLTRLTLAFLAIFCADSVAGIYVYGFAADTLFKPDYFSIGINKSPELFLLPLFYSGIAIAFVYLLLKLKNRSKRNLYLSAGGLIGLPVLARLFTQLLYPTLFGEQTFYNSLRDISFHSFGTSLSGSNFVTTILIVLALVGLGISYKSFTQQDQPFSKKYRIIFISISTLAVLSNIFLLSTILYKTKTTDYGYKTVLSQVDFKLYKPTYIPDNRVYAQPLRISETSYGLQKKAVITVLAQAIGVREVIPQTPHMISLVQAGVLEGFDFKTHLVENRVTDETKATQREIDIKISKDGKGMLTEYTQLNYQPFSLEFMSKENTLVQVFSTDLPLEELVKFVDSLE